MMKYKSITGKLFDPKTDTCINLGTLRNVKMSSMVEPQNLMQELNRRKVAAREAVLRYSEEKAERDKELLHASLSDEAKFSITYVPYVIAEVAWDYADSILNLAALMRLSATKRLCRAIKELRKEYDRERYKIINDKWRESETENMIMFQETLSDFFSEIQKYVCDGLNVKYGEIEYNTKLLIGASYTCRIVLTGLSRYVEAQEKIVASILGYSIAGTLLPKELKQLYAIVKEFAGDTTLDEADFKIREIQFAEKLAEYITDVEINDTDKSTQSSTSKTKMTMEEMNNLVAEINDTIAEFQKDFNLNTIKGNKAAGVRARKASLKLEKLMKQYRKNSVK